MEERKMNRNTDDKYPVISDETYKLLISGEDGKYFHQKKEYYRRLFQKVIEDKTFWYNEIF